MDENIENRMSFLFKHLRKKRSVVPQISVFGRCAKWNMSFWVSISWFPGPRNPLLSIFVPREHLRPQCLPPIIIKAGTMCSTLYMYIYIYKCEKLGLIKAPNSSYPFSPEILGTILKSIRCCFSPLITLKPPLINHTPLGSPIFWWD